MLTNRGLAWIAARVAGPDVDDDIAGIATVAFGEGTTAVTVADEELEAERQRVSVSNVSWSEEGVVEVLALANFNSDMEVGEVGLLDSGTAGNLIDRWNVTGLTASVGSQLELVWRLKFEGA